MARPHVELILGLAQARPNGDMDPMESTINLYARPASDKKDAENSKLSHFVASFARNINEHSTCERRKYPEKYDPPKPTDVILDDKVVRKINPTVKRWRHELEHEICQDFEEHDPLPIIPREERKMVAFLRKYESNDCYEFALCNKDAFFNLEIVKTLILYGEMDPVLRVCAHPDVDLATWWSQYSCHCGVRI